MGYAVPITCTPRNPNQPTSCPGRRSYPPLHPPSNYPIYPRCPSRNTYEAGIPRLAQVHTTIPTRPRTEVITYMVKTGDTVFGIAEQFGLKPETVLWGNYFILADNPHALSEGQELNILPIDGTYHRWSAGEGLNGVAQGYSVTPEDIINWEGNNLDLETLGDFANPNIEPGTFLVVPGGSRQFVTWSAPKITRSNPGVAKFIGPGACGTIIDGAVGTGAFIWPSAAHFLSGYDYSPSTNHFAIDIDGDLGEPMWASDSGVVVYAGWNNFGYGNMVVIDHGNGWQTAYAHMQVYTVGCGQSVFQGTPIGTIGSTGKSSGPHIHFEMLHDNYGKVNPWDFLLALTPIVISNFKSSKYSSGGCLLIPPDSVGFFRYFAYQFFYLTFFVQYHSGFTTLPPGMGPASHLLITHHAALLNDQNGLDHHQ